MLSGIMIQAKRALKNLELRYPNQTPIDLLLGCAAYCNLAQVNTVFNVCDTTLDIIFISNNNNVNIVRVLDPLIAPDAYHPPSVYEAM